MRNPRAAAFLGGLARHWPLIPVLLLAIWLRVRGLEPVQFYGDDAEYGIVASYLASNPFDLAYPRLVGFPEGPFVSQPPLVLYLYGLAYMVFGVSDVAGVWVNLLLGVGTVGLVYALGLQWRDRATAFVAATFLAVMPFHVALSRVALLESGLTFFMTLAAVLAMRYFDAPSARRATWAGVGAGLAVLAKLPGVLVLVVLLLYAGVEAAAWLRAKRRGDAAAGQALQALPWHLLRAAAVSLAFPLAWVLVVLIKGGYENGVEELFQKLGAQADRVAGSASDASSASQPWSWYLADHEFAIPALVTARIYFLAFVGVILALGVFAWRPVEARRNAMVVLWIAVTLGFFSFSDRKVWFYTLPVTPGVALAAAYPLALAWNGLHLALAKAAARSGGVARALGRPVLRHGVQAGVAALLVVAAAVPAMGAAEKAMEREDRKFGQGIEDAALYIRDHGGGGQVGSLLGRFALEYYNPDSDTYHYFNDHLGGGTESPLSYVSGEIDAGRVRWVVYDDYLHLGHEEAWLMSLVNAHDGDMVAQWGNDWGVVKLYRVG